MQQRPPRIVASRSPSRVKILSSSTGKAHNAGARPYSNRTRSRRTDDEDSSDDGYDNNLDNAYEDYDDDEERSSRINNICSNTICHNPKQRWRVIGVSVLVLTMFISLLVTVVSLVHLSTQHNERIQLKKAQRGDISGADSMASSWWSYMQQQTRNRLDQMKMKVGSDWITGKRPSNSIVESITVNNSLPLIETASHEGQGTGGIVDTTTESITSTIVPQQYQNSTTMQMIFTRNYLQKTELQSSQASSATVGNHQRGEGMAQHQHQGNKPKKQDHKTTHQEMDISDSSQSQQHRGVDKHHDKRKDEKSKQHEAVVDSKHDSEIWSEGIYFYGAHNHEIYLQNPPSLVSSLTNISGAENDAHLPVTAVKGLVVLLHSCHTPGDVWWNHELVRSHYLSMGSLLKKTISSVDEGKENNNQQSTTFVKKGNDEMRLHLALPVESRISSALLSDGYITMAFTLSTTVSSDISLDNKKVCWKKEDALVLYQSMQQVVEPLLYKLPTFSILPIHILAIGNGGIFLQNHVLPLLLQKSPSLTFSLSTSSAAVDHKHSQTSRPHGNNPNNLEWLQQSAIAQMQGIALMHCGLYNQQSLTSIYKSKAVHHHHHHRNRGEESNDSHNLKKVSKSLKLMLIDSSRNGDVALHNEQTIEHLKPQVKKAIANHAAANMMMGVDGLDEGKKSLVDQYVQHWVADPYPLTEELLLSVFTPYSSRKNNSNSYSKSSSSYQHSLMISRDETKSLLTALKKEQFLWPANHILVKDPTDPIYMESFKNIIRTTLPRFSSVIDNMQTSSNNHIYFNEDDTFLLKYGKHAISTLFQVIKYSWGYRETTDEFVEEILDWMKVC